MTRTIFVPLFATLLTLSALNSCSSGINEPDFDQVVTINEGEIPKYSEYGLNTAGARIIRSGNDWETNDAWTLFYIGNGISNVEMTKVGGGLMQFFMYGMTSSLELMSVSFYFPAEIPDTLTGLRALVNQEFSVQKSNLIVSFPDNENVSTNKASIKSASLRFTNSRRIIYYEKITESKDSIRYDKTIKHEDVSLSGTFEFAGVDPNNVNVTMNSGRFDILFNAYNGSKYANAVPLYNSIYRPKSTIKR
jgi:hypothetical protein